jgi:hypothetical protein
MSEPISDGELDQLRQRVGGAHLSGGVVEGIIARIDAAEAERDQAVERTARFQQIISDNHHLDFDQMTSALHKAEERATLAYADAQKAEDERDRYLIVVDAAKGLYKDHGHERLADALKALAEGEKNE